MPQTQDIPRFAPCTLESLSEAGEGWGFEGTVLDWEQAWLVGGATEGCENDKH